MKILRYSLVILLVVAVACALVAARPEPKPLLRILFEDDFTGPNSVLQQHAPSGSGFENWIYRVVGNRHESALVQNGSVYCSGDSGYAFSGPSTLYEINNEMEEPEPFPTTLLLETYVRLERSDIPGISNSTFVQFQFPDIIGRGNTSVTVMRDSNGQVRILSVFDDGTSRRHKILAVEVADHDGEGWLFIGFSRVGVVDVVWQPQDEAPLAFVAQGESAVVGPVIRFRCGGGVFLSPNPDVVMDYIWVTEQRLQRATDPKKFE